MRLSTRSRYGLRAICYMAEHVEDGYLPLSEIAANTNLPENYLEQIIRLLKKDKLVDSTRGPKGGYMLTRPNSEITVGEIIRTLEGQTKFCGCLEDGGHCDDKCSAYFAFHRIDEAINGAINSITLETMVNQNLGDNK